MPSIPCRGIFPLLACLGCFALAGPLAAQTPTFEDRVIELVNQHRTGQGLPPLKGHALLAQAAEGHSAAMASRDFFAHCDLDTGEQFFDRIHATGYAPATGAENVAAGQTSPEQVVTVWMNSPGHRANILSSGSREIGVGYVGDPGDAANVRRDTNGDCIADSASSGPFHHYWTQNFGSRHLGFPVVIEREAFSTSHPGVNLYLYGQGWATEMRLRNESGLWTPWLPFDSEMVWQLSPGSGVKAVQIELRRGASVVTAGDTILLTGAGSSDVIFADGFEGGGLERWSSSTP